ncbi:MAG: hypothetical protein U5O69_04000 [Candidatus Competibacteraceae bacterium]|nr:hypothetical protein [Candidatus Competibacteraceae bacterium]
MALVHSANLFDARRTRRKVGAAIFAVVDTVKKIWADGAYGGEALAQWVKAQFDCVLEVSWPSKSDGQGFSSITAAMDC